MLALVVLLYCIWLEVLKHDYACRIHVYVMPILLVSLPLYYIYYDYYNNINCIDPL